MNMKKLKLGLGGLMALSALSLTACSDEQLAFGAGAVVGAVVLGDDGYHHHSSPPRYREGRRRYSIQELGSIAPATDEAQAAADHFQIPIESADRIMVALKAAERSDFSKMAELGVTREDIGAMAIGENPTSSALLNLSQNLNLSLGDTHKVIQQFKVDLAQAM